MTLHNVLMDALDLLYYSLGRLRNTHQTFVGGPVNFVVDADAGLVGLQCVWEAADLQHQEVHGIQNFLAVYHPVSQSLQLAVAHRAGQSTVEGVRQSV